MTRLELVLRAALLKVKQYLFATILAAIGIACLWKSTDSQLSAAVAEVWREGAFAVLATALAIGITEFSRRGNEDLLARTVEETLKENLRDTRLANRLLADLQTLRDARANKLASEILGVKLGTSQNDPLRDSVGRMLDGLSDLQRSTHWAKDVYREYLSAVIQNTSENTHSLCELTAKPSHSRQINLVSRGQRTDEILQKLMVRMQRGCRYLVVSDVQSWLDDKLERFFDETRAAAGRGVQIRRIFVVKDEEIRSGSVTPDEAFSELGRHLKLQSSTRAPGYRIRLYQPVMRLHLANEKLEILKDHFGIFAPANEGPCVHVKVERTNLSLLTLTNLSPRDSVHTYFDAVWKKLDRDLTKNTLEQAKNRWTMIAKAGTAA